VSVNDFVEECRREWRRLRVPNRIANEMAADLKADLDEAEAEGASPEAVLGSEAFDPRSFAASWAAERGVVGPPPLARVERLPRRSRLLAGIGVSALVALIGVVLVSVRAGVSVAVAQARPAFRFPPSPVGVPQGSVVHAHAAFPTIGLLLLLVGVAGAILALVYWSPWTVRISPRRSHYTDE
jgi:hypothetical protein